MTTPPVTNASYIVHKAEEITTKQVESLKQRIATTFPENSNKTGIPAELSQMIAHAVTYYKQHPKDFTLLDLERTIDRVADIEADEFMQPFVDTLSAEIAALPQNDERIKALCQSDSHWNGDVDYQKDQSKTVRYYRSNVKTRLIPYISEAVKAEYEQQHTSILVHLKNLFTHLANSSKKTQ